MDPNSKLYNTKISREDVLKIFENSFKTSIGDVSEQCCWKKEVFDKLNENSEIVIGKAYEMVDIHKSEKLVRFYNAPIDKFKNDLKLYYKNIDIVKKS